MLGLVLASVAGQISRYVLGHGHLFGLVDLFYVDVEDNIPTWYSSSMLLVCALLLGAIGSIARRDGDRFAAHWGALSLLFVCLSLDEAVSIHERVTELLRALMNAHGVLFFTWVIPGAAMTALLGLAYLRFLAHLPRSTRRLVLLAACLYVGGALGMEMVGGLYVERYNMWNLPYSFLATLEEWLEMQAVVVFVYALLSHLSVHGGGLYFRVGDALPAAHDHSK